MLSYSTGYASIKATCGLNEKFLHLFVPQDIFTGEHAAVWNVVSYCGWFIFHWSDGMAWLAKSSHKRRRDHSTRDLLATDTGYSQVRVQLL